MKIIINATTCTVGGSIQVATGFIFNSFTYIDKHKFYYCVSSSVAKNTIEILKPPQINMFVFENSPAKIKKGRGVRRKLLELEEKLKPDIILTVFGPSYVKFKSLHVCGFADGWITHPTDLALQKLNLLEKIRLFLITKYKLFNLGINDFYWTESEVSKNGLAKKLKISCKKIKVIPNCYNQIYAKNTHERKFNTLKDKFNIFVLGVPYKHKNFLIVPKIAYFLKQKNINNFKFLITLPENNRESKKILNLAKKLKVEDLIKNVGQLDLKACLGFYKKSDIVFLPTLLETFSVTYLESMKMEVPIVTSDLDFARWICGDAAQYFNPLSVESAVRAICSIINNKVKTKQMIEKGKLQLKKFPTPIEKIKAHIEHLEEIYKNY